MIANIYYILFNKLIKTFFYFENFKALIIKSSFSIKVIKIQGLLSFANNFYSYFLDLINIFFFI